MGRNGPTMNVPRTIPATNVQKMERKTFSRVADNRHTSGFYANVIFTAAPALIATLRSKFALNEEVFRVIFTDSPEIKPAK